MKKAFSSFSIVALASLLLVLAVAPAVHAAAIDVLVGDKDLYGGACTSDIGVGTCIALTTTSANDFRDAGEKIATNGAQYTDEYDALGFGVTSATSIAFLMPFTSTLTAGATLTVAVADLQSSTFGEFTADINGEVVPFFHDDGFQADNIYTFILTAGQTAAANVAGMVTFDVARGSSGDFVAFDWVELTGTTTAPEPATLSLLGAGLGALVVALRRRNS